MLYIIMSITIPAQCTEVYNFAISSRIMTVSQCSKVNVKCSVSLEHLYMMYTCMLVFGFLSFE